MKRTFSKRNSIHCGTDMNKFENCISAGESSLFQVQSAPKEIWFGQHTYGAEIYTLIDNRKHTVGWSKRWQQMPWYSLEPALQAYFSSHTLVLRWMFSSHLEFESREWWGGRINCHQVGESEAEESRNGGGAKRKIRLPKEIVLFRNSVRSTTNGIWLVRCSLCLSIFELWFPFWKSSSSRSTELLAEQRVTITSQLSGSICCQLYQPDLANAWYFKCWIV